MQKLLSKMRQAINDFNLIEDGDKLSESLNKIYEVMLNMDNALGNSYNLTGNIIGGKK